MSDEKVSKPKRTSWGEVECPSCGNAASLPRVIFGKGIGANADYPGPEAHPCIDLCHPWMRVEGDE